MRYPLISWCMLFIAGVALAASPGPWVSRGIGAGGAMFAPSISPFNGNEFYIACDMGDLFHTTNGGGVWSTVDFNQIQAFHSTEIQFTSDPSILYALDYHQAGGTGANVQMPAFSRDGGAIWTRIPPSSWPYGYAYRVIADPQSTNRLIAATWSNVYFSADSGASFTLAGSSPTNHVAGAFFDGSNIVVACNAGLLVSTNNGNSFTNTGATGIDPGCVMGSFAGARQSGTTRFYAVSTFPSLAIPDSTASFHTTNRIFTMDWGQPSWTPVMNGISTNIHPMLVALSPHDIHTAYIASHKANSRYPDNNTILKTTDSGTNWTSVFSILTNSNIAAGWGGDRPVCAVNYALPAGFVVAPTDPLRVIKTDSGLAVMTTNGGTSWFALYDNPADLNPTNTYIPQSKAYRGVGLEPTACWWVHWTSPSNMLAAFSDILMLRSSDAGASWSFDYTLNPNTNLFNDLWQFVQPASTNLIYAVIPALWTPNGVLNGSDNYIDPAPGWIYMSSDTGKTWNFFKDLGEPSVSMALDPNHNGWMYVATVDSTNGAVWLTTNLFAGASSSWQRLSAHPRSRGHPYNIHVLHDGTLAVGYGAGITPAIRFTSGSGVFICTNLPAALAGDTNAWANRSSTGMVYWTQDVVIDPADPGESNWYACVWNGWGISTNGYGNPMGCGGLYKTTDRGLSWTKIFTNDATCSCAFNPANPDELYLASHSTGLWSCTNIHSATPVFTPVPGYPFRNPTRIFFNPYNPLEIWITSNGNGLRAGTVTPTGIEAWRYVHFNLTADYGIAADLADPDGDGLVNLAEYALGTDPASATNAAWEAVGLITDTNSAASYLTITATRNVAATDVLFSAEACSDLTPGQWTNAVTVLQSNASTFTVRDNIPVTTAPHRFLKLDITRH